MYIVYKTMCPLPLGVNNAARNVYMNQSVNYTISVRYLRIYCALVASTMRKFVRFFVFVRPRVGGVVCYAY